MTQGFHFLDPPSLKKTSPFIKHVLLNSLTPRCPKTRTRGALSTSVFLTNHHFTVVAFACWLEDNMNFMDDIWYVLWVNLDCFVKVTWIYRILFHLLWPSRTVCQIHGFCCFSFLPSNAICAFKVWTWKMGRILGDGEGVLALKEGFIWVNQAEA